MLLKITLPGTGTITDDQGAIVISESIFDMAANGILEQYGFTLSDVQLALEAASSDVIAAHQAGINEARQLSQAALQEALAKQKAAEERVSQLEAELKRTHDVQAELIARGRAAIQKVAAKLPPEVREGLSAEVGELLGVLVDGTKPVAQRQLEALQAKRDALVAEIALKEQQIATGQFPAPPAPAEPPVAV